MVDDRFEQAVVWLSASAARMLTVDGRFAGAGQHPDYLMTAVRTPSIRLANGAFLIRDDVCKLLLAAASQNLGSFHYAAAICAENIQAGVPLPTAMRSFAGMAITRFIDPPSESSRRATDWIENLACFTMIRGANRRFGLRRTRNDESSAKTSACDAVEAAFHRLGYRRITYARLKRLCTARHLQLAAEAAEIEALMSLEAGRVFYLRMPENRPEDYMRPVRHAFECQFSASIGPRPMVSGNRIWPRMNGGQHDRTTTHHAGSMFIPELRSDHPLVVAQAGHRF